jgi:hypothetical protein
MDARFWHTNNDVFNYKQKEIKIVSFHINEIRNLYIFHLWHKQTILNLPYTWIYITVIFHLSTQLELAQFVRT